MPCRAKNTPTLMQATTSIATTDAVSILPTGGRTRRIGTMNGLVMRTTAWHKGLRKSARAHCSSNRARTTNRASESSVSMMKISALMDWLSPSPAGTELRCELAAASRRCLHGPSQDPAEIGGLQYSDCCFGRAPLGGDFCSQPAQVSIAAASELPGALQRRQRKLPRNRRVQPQLGRAARQQFGDQEEIGGPAARQGRHHIELIFAADPGDLAYRLQH